MPEFSFTRNVPCETATEFIEAVSPRGSTFRSAPPQSSWLFRGHGSNHYQLVASALRPSERTKLHALAGNDHLQGPDLNTLQILAEALVVRHFFEAADSHGLAIPEDSPQTRSNLHAVIGHMHHALQGGDLSPNSTCKWPSHGIIGAMALAQHFGLPTRLLDWSRSSFTASYFAATDAIANRKDDDRLALWATDQHCIRRLRLDIAVEFASAARAGNSNLHAQDGLFTVSHRGELALMEEVDRTPLDLLLDNFLPETGRKQLDCIFYRFTLPVDQAGKLLWLLAKEGYSVAKLFPGYRGAAELVKERQLWENPS